MGRRWTSLVGLAVVAAAVVLAAGCSSGGTPKAGGSPTPAPAIGGTGGDQFGVSPGPSASPAGSVSPGALPPEGVLTSPTQGKPGVGEIATELTEAGIGPYQVGAAQTTLANQGRLAGVKTTTGCPGWATATGTGGYTGVDLVFYNGKLNWVQVDTTAITARSGGRVGLTLSQVQGLYPGSVLLTAGLGAKAVAVRNIANGNELFFRFGATGTVSIIEAGPTETLEFRFTDGEGC